MRNQTLAAALLAALTLCPCAPTAAPRAPQSRYKAAVASYYHLPGRRTASGEPYGTGTKYGSRSAFASRHMPFGTVVEFRYRGRVARGVCNDRGPFVRGRSIDLNKHLATALGFKGVGKVQYRVCGKVAPKKKAAPAKTRPTKGRAKR